ncbi:MAG: exodeoxyribonuclease VII large subunit [Alphaproteobacteria bacterium]
MDDLPLTEAAAWNDAAQPAARPNLPEYTVSELSLALKRAIEDGFGFVRVRGEVSGWKRHGSGHCYFALKDSDAVIDAVCWRGTATRLDIKPEDGMEVVCSGRLTTYAGRSKYQLVVERIELAGIGALLKLLEERRQRLMAEGLFAAERKRKLPFLPEVIGIVTSPTGAVIRDILHRLADRFPRRVLLWPVAVQGDGAAAQIAAAIEGFNRIAPGGPGDTGVPRPDLLIVARGGGSIEDLMAFNEEIVVRAAAASAIPLISAVGHETDTTLIDHASDRRAPTPTAAAEMAVPVRLDLVADLGGRAARLAGGLSRLLTESRLHLAGLARGLPDPQDLLGAAAQRLDDRSERLLLAIGARFAAARQRLDLAASGLRPAALAGDVERARERFAAVENRLAPAMTRVVAGKRDALDNFAGRLATHSERHESLLARGYVVVRDAAGAVVTEAAAVRPNTALELEFHDGKVGVVAGVGASVGAGGGGPRRAARRTASRIGQPSLFDGDC